MAEAELGEVFAQLKTVLAAYANEMEVNADSDVAFGLQTHGRRPKDGYPRHFGSVKIGRRYVSDHLMPLYAFPELTVSLSDALRRRMQGKSCFNFSVVDEALFTEVAQVTQRGYEAFAENGLLENADG